MKLLVQLACLALASVSSEKNLHLSVKGQDRSLVLSKQRSATPEDSRAYEKQQLAIERAASTEESSAENSPIVVPVCFHVITDSTMIGDIDNVILQAQLDAINKAFTAESCCDPSLSWCPDDAPFCSIDTGISFRMAEFTDDRSDITRSTVDSVTSDRACVTRTSNDAWGFLQLRSPEETEMKSALHLGNAQTVNVYFTDVDGFLGYSTYPWQLEDGLRDQDGIIIDYNTLPGSSNSFYNEGDALVHELGHWFGLLTTFAGGCGISDGISDTPKAAQPNFRCSPPATNSCPGDDESDPIFNFMDWSDDACLYEFTEKQSEVMYAAWVFFRVGDTSIDTINLDLGEASDPVLLAPGQTVYFRAETTVCSMVCVSSASEGNADMFLAMDSPPLMDPILDLCASQNGGSIESCAFTEEDSTLQASFLFGIFPFSLLPRFCETFPFRWICDLDLNPFDDDGQTDPAPDGLCSPGEKNFLYVGMRTAINSTVTDLRVRCETR